jgi:hypothetical protein
MKQHERTTVHNENVKKNATFVDCSVCGSVHLAGSCPTTASTPVEPKLDVDSNAVGAKRSDANGKPKSSKKMAGGGVNP